MTTTTIDLGKIMNRVQALLAKADGSEYPEEATAFRAKAEQLMRQYRIEEEQLIASDQVEIVPEVHALWLGGAYDHTRASSGGRSAAEGRSFYNEWYSLAVSAAIHAGAKIHYRWARNPETIEYGIYAVMVGYSGDLRLAELIYTNARIAFGESLEPKPDPLLSDQVNAYRLRSAGITRDRIAQMLWGGVTHARAARVGKMYKEECIARGETPALDGRGINAALYRDQFARSFVQELTRRLRGARDAADSVGGALVLHGRTERVEEAFWTEFPELRPQPKETAAVAVVDETAGKQVKRRGRAPMPYWETAAGRREAERAHSGLVYAARAAGQRAAGEVELDRPKPAQRVARGPLGELEG